MHPRLREIVDYLAESRTVLLDALAAIPETLREERPRADAWTPGEVIGHLAMVEGSVARLLDRRAERARAEGLALDAETSSVLGCIDDRRIDVVESRIDAPEIVRPASGTSAAAALDSLAGTRRALLAAIDRADGLDLTAIGARHPVLGELDLYAWLVMVGKHERRHARQLESLHAALASR